MPPPDDTQPIADDEVLYRRIPVSQGWYDHEVDYRPSPQAFKPRENDATGLSLVRGDPFNTAQQAAQGPSKKGYYVAVLRAGDLRQRGIQVVPRPIEGISGHAEIPDLTAANRNTDSAMSRMVLLAQELCLRVEGPFHSR